MPASPAVIDWLLDSDPAIRWQVMRDLLDAPEAGVARRSGRGSRPRAGARGCSPRQDAGRPVGRRGLRAGRTSTSAAWREEGQPWTATCCALTQLREFGLDPRVGERRGARSSWSGRTRAGRKAASRSGRARSRSASTAGPSPTAPTSASTSGRSSRGCSASGRPTAAGTASGPTGRCGRRSTRRSTCSRGCSSTRRRPAARRRCARRAGRARRILLERRLFRRALDRRAGRPELPAVPAPEPLALRHPARRSTTSAPRLRSTGAPGPAARRGRSPSCAGGGSPDGRWPLDWTPARRGSGSRSTTARASRRAGSRSARSGCCGGGTAQPAARRRAASVTDEGAPAVRPGRRMKGPRRSPAAGQGGSA